MLASVALALLTLQSAGALPDLQTTKNVIPLRKTYGAMSPSSQALWAMRNEAMGLATTIPVGEGVTYDAEVEIGDQSFRLIWDTGSADLWVPLSTFQCYTVNKNRDHVAQPQSACRFGPLYNGTFDEGKIADENFNVHYGYGGFASGTFGYNRVSFGGITIGHQEMALVNETYWVGAYGICSGVFGFAFPHLTSGYAGNDPAKDTNATAIHHNPWVFNAIAEKKIAPLFSLALERGSDGGHGHVALGGLPDVDFVHDFASTPIEARAITSESQNTTAFTYYTIIPHGYTVNGSQVSTDFPFIVDSGSTFVNLPDAMAKHINGLFDPPAQYSESLGAWLVECHATPPRFGVTIGGKTFYVNPEDMLVKNAVGQTPPSGKCLTGVQPVGSGMPAFLGDVFLKSVVAVFDIGSSEMHFAPHEHY